MLVRASIDARSTGERSLRAGLTEIRLPMGQVGRMGGKMKEGEEREKVFDF